jgi:glycine dehydrogenase subunit 2
MAGMKTLEIKSDADGNADLDDLRAIIAKHADRIAGLMITNPNTLGLFEGHIQQVCDMIHEAGGLVYGDGANFNAILGIVRPGDVGIDIMHYNLHKTFSTPHGGGGPGSGPVCVTEKLEKFLPVPRVLEQGGRYTLSNDFPDSIGKIHAFYGNFSILVRAYSYIRSLGPDLKKVSQYAVLNANYIKESLKDTFHLPYDRPCMHECVFNDAKQEAYKVTTLDIAKRLIDNGVHPPTIYFPLVVPGALMIEPTESECKEDIDRFIETLKDIAVEARENPDALHAAPVNTKVKRLDETLAARKPCLRG